MMVWSITYHSWLTFVLLLWACLIWTVRSRHQLAMLCSPFILLYGLALCGLRYVWAMDLRPELPTTLGPVSLRQLGLEHTRSPCLDLGAMVSVPPTPGCLGVGTRASVAVTVLSTHSAAPRGEGALGGQGPVWPSLRGPLQPVHSGGCVGVCGVSEPRPCVLRGAVPASLACPGARRACPARPCIRTCVPVPGGCGGRRGHTSPCAGGSVWARVSVGGPGSDPR
ncbi:uncharacterized protein LOC117800369 [Ailuropoda melanoleuca]|uniref:uncharacterized protein LOC117800369 n=1 Tax=Ailuropoda melanoleuca TaxID=9646 RepID=UPI00149481DC|nr:uncharacterized protein LOC117800369 [Ailuropoda melanoleuca]